MDEGPHEPANPQSELHLILVRPSILYDVEVFFVFFLEGEDIIALFSKPIFLGLT